MIEQEIVKTNIDWRQQYDDQSVQKGVEHVVSGKSALFILYDWNNGEMVRTLVYFDTKNNKAVIEKPKEAKDVPLESHAIALLRKITVLASRELNEQREFPDILFSDRSEGTELSQLIEENTHTRIAVPLTTEPKTRHYVLFHEKVRGADVNLPTDVLGPMQHGWMMNMPNKKVMVVNSHFLSMLFLDTCVKGDQVEKMLFNLEEQKYQKEKIQMKILFTMVSNVI